MRPTLCLLAALATTACGPRELRVTMKSDNNSGQTGFAVVTDQGAKGITVVVETSAPENVGPQYAHIHSGNCGEVGPIRANLLKLEALTAADKVGRAGSTSAEVLLLNETKLMTFAMVSTGEWIINVHDERDFQVYVSCGEIPKL